MPKNDKKQEIMDLLEQIDNSNEYALFIVYGTVKTALMEQESSKKGIIERVQVQVMEEMKKKFIEIIENINDIDMLEYLITYVSLTLESEEQRIWNRKKN